MLRYRHFCFCMLILFFGLSERAIACNAQNDQGDTCSISCDTGQAEMCMNGTGGSPPLCYCSGAPAELNTLASHVMAEMVLAPAQTTDVNATIAKLLNDYGPVPVTTYHNEVRPGPVFCSSSRKHRRCSRRNTTITVPNTSNQILNASNIVIVSRSDLTYGTVEFKDFPDDLYATYVSSVNCRKPISGISPPSTSASLSLSGSRSTSITFSKTFTNGGSIQAGGGISVMGLSLSTSVNVSQSQTTGTSSLDSSSQTFAMNDTAVIQQSWSTKSLAGLIAHKIAIYVPFHFTATVDADLSQNDKNFKKLSDILDSGKRTFDVVGQIETDTASKAVVTYFDSVPVETADCIQPGMAINNIIVKPIAGKLDTWMLNLQGELK